MRDLAERHDPLEVRHLVEGAGQEHAAGLDLVACRLVFRRHAADGVRDAGVDQFERVVGALLIVALGEAEFLERRVKQVAGVVAGEGTAGLVRAMQPRRKAHDQETRARRSERGHGRVEIAGKLSPVRLTKSRKPRAERTVAARLGEFGSRFAQAPWVSPLGERCRKFGAFCIRAERSAGSRPIFPASSCRSMNMSA